MLFPFSRPPTPTTWRGAGECGFDEDGSYSCLAVTERTGEGGVVSSSVAGRIIVVAAGAEGKQEEEDEEDDERWLLVLVLFSTLSVALLLMLWIPLLLLLPFVVVIDTVIVAIGIVSLVVNIVDIRARDCLGHALNISVALVIDFTVVLLRSIESTSTSTSVSLVSDSSSLSEK